MKPSEKSPEVEKFLTAIFGDRREAIETNHCQPEPLGCGRKISMENFNTWRPIEQKEYLVSGLCETCQRTLG